jgi:hypothetical protein
MIKTMIDLGLNEDDTNVDLNVTSEMTIGMTETDDIEDTEMIETEIVEGKRPMKSERKGGEREGRGMIGIVIDPESLIDLTPERGARGEVVGFEI